MNNTISTLLIFAALAAVGVGGNKSPIRQCKGQTFEDLQNRINVDPCSSNKCKLVKNTNTTVSFRLKLPIPSNDLINDVHAVFGNLELPYLGVHGQSACANIRRADTGEAASCPLEAGVEYIIKNKFYIEPSFPEIPFMVRWSLKDQQNQDVICFEVPAVIKKSKNKES